MRFLLLNVPARISEGLSDVGHIFIEVRDLDDMINAAKEGSGHDVVLMTDPNQAALLRRGGVAAPIFCTVAVTPTLADRIAFMMSGGDDLFNWCVSLSEILATATARLRLVSSSIGEDLTIRLLDGRLRINLIRLRAFVDESPVHFTHSEIVMLVALTERPGVPLSRNKLLDLLNIDLDTDFRAIDVRIKRIRRRLDKALPGLSGLIKGMYGVGYYIDPDFVLS